MKTLEETHYVQSLEEFIKRCDQEPVTLNWIRAKMPPLLKAAQWPVKTAEVVRVIGVGSGNGESIFFPVVYSDNNERPHY